MDYEKKYKEALERAKEINRKDIKLDPSITTYEYIFPELKESEDEKNEKVRIGLIKAFNTVGKSKWGGLNVQDILAWLEKQKEYESTDFEYVWDRTDCGDLTSALDKYSKEAIINMCHAWYDKGVELERKSWLGKQGDQNLVNFEEAEKEKSDFVSGKFIQCRKSFNEFKEDNSYWLEYIGDDTYIGRSDNILNQKFHITPRQLYRLFSQEHCIKNNNEETNAPFGYGKNIQL